MTVSEPSMRADARRNRDAMLAAARQIFAERGLDAPLDLIARTAGVSRATQHRHFPTRESLVRAIFVDEIDTLATIAETTDDPAEAYVEVLLATVQMLVRDRGFVELFDRSPVAEDVKRELTSRFLAVVSEPLRRAQEAGRIRADLRPDDTMLFVDMLGATAHPLGPGQTTGRVERAVAFVLDAIAATPVRRATGPQ